MESGLPPLENLNKEAVAGTGFTCHLDDFTENVVQWASECYRINLVQAETSQQKISTMSRIAFYPKTAR